MYLKTLILGLRERDCEVMRVTSVLEPGATMNKECNGKNKAGAEMERDRSKLCTATLYPCSNILGHKENHLTVSTAS